VHPLVKQAARALTPATLDRLRRELPRLEGETLRDAVRSLIFLGVLLTESGRDATPIFALVESRAILEALDRATATQLAKQHDAGDRRSLSRFEAAREPEAMRRGERIRVEDLGARRFAGLRLR
jgi:hypothetical protein